MQRALTESGTEFHVARPVIHEEGGPFDQTLWEAKLDIVTVSQDILQIQWDVANTEYDKFVRSRTHVQQVAKRHRRELHQELNQGEALAGQEPDLRVRCRRNMPGNQPTKSRMICTRNAGTRA